LKINVELGTISQLDNRPMAVVHIETSPLEPAKRHTVLVLDCSTSMTASLPDVRRDSQKYISELGDKDWASIIIFSGHNTTRLIAGPTQCTKDGRSLLGRAIEKEVRPIGTTVFSEPLKLTLNTVNRLAGKDTSHNAVLFTDGCAVPTRWSVEEEHKKAFNAASALKQFEAVVSVIGYGVYYDEEFIKALMVDSGNSGVYRHISEIDDFGPTIDEIRTVFHKTSFNSFDLTFTPNFGNVFSIFRTTPEVYKISKGDRAVSKGLYEGKVTLFLQLTAPCSSLTIKGTIDGKIINETPADSKLSPESAADFIRVIAAHAFLSGDKEAAAELLQLTDDMGLAERTASSYTVRESRETGDLMRRVFRDRKFIGAGLKPTGPNHCVLNVMREIIEDSKNVVFLGENAYKRSGELTSDPRVIHPPMRYLKVLGYKSAESRLNFSFLCLKDVKILPETGNGPPIDKKIWRTYNVILDGNLRIPELKAVLSEKSFKSLQDAGVIDSSALYSKTKIYTLNLRDLKTVSSAWSNPSILGLVPLLREERELEAEQTALNARCKATAPAAPIQEEDNIYYPKETKVEGMPVETYTAPCIEIRLMKYKPKNYDCCNLSYAEAEKRVKEVRQRLTAVRYLIRAITFSMEVTNSKTFLWDSGKINNYGKLEQMTMYQGAVLKKVSWSESFVCS